MKREGFLGSVQLLEAERGEVRSGYPWELPVVAGLAAGLELDPQLTYLIGENGSGKSTLLGAIAHAAGIEPVLGMGPVRELVVARLGRGSDEILTGKLPFSDLAKKVHEVSLREALSLGRQHIGSEHLNARSHAVVGRL